MTDEYPTIRKRLDAELEQLAKGVELERQREYLQRVRPALYAIQEQLAIDEVPVEITDPGLAAKLRGLIQKEADFADDLLAVEQYATDAVKQRQQKEEAKDPLREAIYAVERETTPSILQISKTLAEMVGDENFNADFSYSLKNDACLVTAKKDEKEIELLVRKLVEYKGGRVPCEMRLTINPEDEGIGIKFKEEGCFHIPIAEEETIKIKVKNRLSLFSKRPEDAFKIIADRYAVERKSDDKEENAYLQAFLEMYAALPKIILEAAKKFRAEEAKRRESLEARAEGIRQLAEGTG